VTITGNGGGQTHTLSISLSVTTGGGSGGTGGVTVTPAVSTSAWYNEEVLRLSNTGALTSLDVSITIQRTTGVSYSGQYNTIGAQVAQGHTSSATTIDYKFTLASGQTLSPGSGYTFATQTSGSGTVHPTAGDIYTVTYTTGGVSYTQSGHF
jgi:hypothetical protein